MPTWAPGRRSSDTEGSKEDRPYPHKALGIVLILYLRNFKHGLSNEKFRVLIRGILLFGVYLSGPPWTFEIPKTPAMAFAPSLDANAPS